MRHVVIMLAGVVLLAFIGGILTGVMAANDVNPSGAGTTQIILHFPVRNPVPTLQHPITGP
jgi:hypothetical protein